MIGYVFTLIVDSTNIFTYHSFSSVQKHPCSGLRTWAQVRMNLYADSIANNIIPNNIIPNNMIPYDISTNDRIPNAS